MFLEDALKDAKDENKHLREIIRQQGEFILSLKEMVRDFVYETPVSLGSRRGRRGY